MYSGMYPSRNSCNSMGISLIRLPRISLFQAMISRRSRCLALDSIHSATASSLAPVATNSLKASADISAKPKKKLSKGQSKCYSPFVPASTERHLSSVRLATTYPARVSRGLAGNSFDKSSASSDMAVSEIKRSPYRKRNRQSQNCPQTTAKTVIRSMNTRVLMTLDLIRLHAYEHGLIRNLNPFPFRQAKPLSLHNLASHRADFI